MAVGFKVVAAPAPRPTLEGVNPTLSLSTKEECTHSGGFTWKVRNKNE